MKKSENLKIVNNITNNFIYLNKKKEQQVGPVTIEEPLQ